jgi:hypothetical protein
MTQIAGGIFDLCVFDLSDIMPTVKSSNAVSSGSHHVCSFSRF